MFACLDGILKHVDEQSIIVSVQGLGFKVSVSNYTRSELPEIGKPVSLWIETVIRAENIQLCGFINKFEQHCFQKLIQVQGVGVRVAVAVLSVCSPQVFYQAITNQEPSAIEKAGGVGKKLAQRVILELKGKITPDESIMNLDSNTPITINTMPAIKDASDALIQLGYSANRIEPILTQLTKRDPEITTQSMIKLALQNLSGSS